MTLTQQQIYALATVPLEEHPHNNPTSKLAKWTGYPHEDGPITNGIYEVHVDGKRRYLVTICDKAVLELQESWADADRISERLVIREQLSRL